MPQKSFATQLFGYDKLSVQHRLAKYEAELARTRSQNEELQAYVAQLETQKEKLSTSVAAMRRQHIQVFNQGGTQPVAVMVGPTDSITMIANIIDLLEGAPYLYVQFRIFREGYYQVTGKASDREKFVAWLRSQSDFWDVFEDREIVHVVPKGVSA